jgi:hypothetical protein
VIVPDFPDILAEFPGKWFTLLWRGGRDDFGAREFHGHCDGPANALAVILDTAGNVFGGFTPVKWESRFCVKADASLKSCLFTLKNTHNFPAQRCALKAERKHVAICCDSDCGPNFCDIAVSDNCNANTGSLTYRFGESYTNNTGLDGKTFFTGSRNFKGRKLKCSKSSTK